MRSIIVIRALFLAAIPVGGVFTSAKADFVIKNAPQPSVRMPAPPVAMAPIVDPGDPGYTNTATRSATPDAQTTIHWKMAFGFGDKVPLAFACRQIVPPAVKVTFGPGANPKMLVSWKGGDMWNNVLRAAVKPLGLHLVMTHMAVEVRK